ncbi:MAG: hypothetical protein ABEJ25_08050 [Candidatus Bipolaricaulia bacterium]
MEVKRQKKDGSLIDFSLTLAMGVSYWSSDQERDVEEALKEADKNVCGRDETRGIAS